MHAGAFGGGTTVKPPLTVPDHRNLAPRAARPDTRGARFSVIGNSCDEISGWPSETMLEPLRNLWSLFFAIRFSVFIDCCTFGTQLVSLCRRKQSQWTIHEHKNTELTS